MSNNHILYQLYFYKAIGYKFINRAEISEILTHKNNFSNLKRLEEAIKNCNLCELCKSRNKACLGGKEPSFKGYGGKKFSLSFERKKKPEPAAFKWKSLKRVLKIFGSNPIIQKLLFLLLMPKKAGPKRMDLDPLKDTGGLDQGFFFFLGTQEIFFFFKPPNLYLFGFGEKKCVFFLGFSQKN